MDIVDCLLKTHGELRGSLESLTVLLGSPRGVGWDDQSALDKEKFSRELAEFLSVFKAHEAVEDAFLSRVVRQIDPDPDLDAAITEGHRSLESLTRIFGVVAASCDGEHVHGVRTALGRLREELETHLAYEEESVFPRLRSCLRAGLLQELGRRASLMTARRP